MKKAVIIALLFFLSGCATIMHGDSQYVKINSIPSGASAYVNGTYFTAPAKVLLKRGYPLEEQQILIQKEGYKPGYASVSQKLSGWLWGDILWGIIPGLVIDFITGGAFNLAPTEITVELKQSAK